MLLLLHFIEMVYFSYVISQVTHFCSIGEAQLRM